MGRIAVDVVLLPDQAMTEWALEVNRRLVQQGGSQLALGKETRLPHISLAMGCIDERDVDSVRKRLHRIANETPVRRLIAAKILVSPNSQGGYTSLLDIERAGDLQALHESVMQEVESLFSQDATEAMIADDAVAESTLEWIRSYRQKAAFERFSPHITLGYGNAETNDSFPIPFAVTQLALCHLGNHGTCRHVIFGTDLP